VTGPGPAGRLVGGPGRGTGGAAAVGGARAEVPESQQQTGGLK